MFSAFGMGNISAFLSAVAFSAAWLANPAFVIGVAEVAYRDGLVWCQAPIGFAIGNVFF